MTLLHDKQPANPSETPYCAAEDAEIKARARMIADQACGNRIATMALLDAATLLTVALAAGMPDPRAAVAELLSEQAQNTLELLEAVLPCTTAGTDPLQRKS